MKKYFGLLFSLIIITALILFIFLHKINFSPNENRYLEKLPSVSLKALFNGELMKDIESYTQDHFPFRTFFLSLKAKTEIAIGKDENNGVYICKDNYLITKPAMFDEVLYSKLVTVWNNFEKENKDIGISLLLAPTSIELNTDKLPKKATYVNELEKINYIYSNLKEKNTNIKLLNVYDDLKIAKDNGEDYLYYRLDHHWTTMAAYIAYTRYAKENNLEIIDKSNFNITKVTDNFNGTTYSKANVYFFKPDEVYAYSHKTNKFRVSYPTQNTVYDSMFFDNQLVLKNKYAYFLDGDFDIIQIQNLNATNMNNLLVIKDSYANCFVPIVANNFNQTHVIDLRHYKSGNVTEYIKENKITHVLILYNTETLSTELLKLK